MQDEDAEGREEFKTKLKSRIIVGFVMIILVPLLLFAATLYGMAQSQNLSQPQTAEIVMETEGSGYEGIAIAQSNGRTQIQIMVKDLFLAAFIILIFTAMAVGLWIYRSFAAPLV